MRHRARGSRSMALVAGVAALLASALGAPASSLAAHGHRSNVPLVGVLTPQPGDVTVEVVTTTLRNRHKGKAPTLTTTTADPAGIPASEVALTATRVSHSRHGAVYHTVLLVLNRRLAHAARRAHAALENLSGVPPKLIESGTTKTLKTLEATLAFIFTGVVVNEFETWEEEKQDKIDKDLTKGLNVGAQANANTSNDNAAVCKAVDGALQPSSTGVLPSSVQPGVIDNGNAPGGWKAKLTPKQKEETVHAIGLLAFLCRSKGATVSAALVGIEKMLGLEPGELEEPPGKQPESPPPPKPIGPEQFGAALDKDPDRIAEATEDFVLWLEEEFFGGTEDVLRASPFPVFAHAAGVRSGAVPANGQVTKVEVRGHYVGGCPVKPESVCEDNLHFQDLRPLPDGKLLVVSTTQPFTLPTTEGTYSFVPENFFVEQGDFIGLSTVGGSWDVLVSAGGVKTGWFVGHEKDMNGSEVTSTRPQTGEELNMRVTLQPK